MQKISRSTQRYLEYLASIEPRAAEEMLRKFTDRRISVPKFHVWLCEGNGSHALLLSQIVYWSEINEDTDQPRISHQFGGHLWVVKTYAEYTDETGLSERLVRSIITKYSKQDDPDSILVVEHHISPFKSTHGVGAKVTFARINWPVYYQKRDEYVRSFGGVTQNVTPDGMTQTVTPGVSQTVSPIYTETTPETTPKTNTKTPSNAGASNGGKKTAAQQDEMRAVGDKYVPDDGSKPKPKSIDEQTALEKKLSACFNKRQHFRFGGITSSMSGKLSERKVINLDGEDFNSPSANELWDTEPLFQEFLNVEKGLEAFIINQDITPTRTADWISGSKCLAEFYEWRKTHPKYLRRIEQQKRNDRPKPRPVEA